MARCALINSQDQFVQLRTDIDPTAQTKAGFRWLPCPAVEKPPYDPLTEKITGPTYTVGANSVTEVWTKVALDAGEITAIKDAAVNAVMNGSWQVNLRVAHLLDANDRAIRKKINDIITAANLSGSVTAFPNGQTQDVTLNQVKTFIRNTLT